MSQPDTKPEIIFPVQTLAEFMAADESGVIPATEPPDDVPTFTAGQKLTPAQLARLDRAVRGIE